MKSEKLIAGLSKEAYGSDVEELLLEASTALYTLQIENQALRTEKGKMSRPDQVTREIPPCKGCAERHEACLGMCEKYKAWKERLEAVKKRQKEYLSKPFVRYNPFDY